MVFVPFISRSNKKLEKRKGGGGRGGSGGRGGGGAGGGGGRGSTISAGGGSKTASSTGRGGGPVSTIPGGQPFAGRSQGGGTRDQVFGTKQYGSGYPGVSGRGVDGRGFPFFFWPLAWGGAAGFGGAAYLHTRQYGSPTNSTRPGGPLFTATLPSNSSSNSTFRLLSDNATVVSLVADIVASCGSSLSSPSSITPSPYNDTGPPVPEQAVQYYRASSVSLTLDGYNNTAVFSSDQNTPDTPLPNNTDTSLLNCLNTTIGDAVPLVDSAYGMRWSSPSNLGLFVLVWIISRLAAEA